MTDAPKAETPVVASPAPAAGRRDPLALVVRFQSVIGLVLVLIGGVVFSPVAARTDHFSVARQHRQYYSRDLRDRHYRARHDLRHHHRRH